MVAFSMDFQPLPGAVEMATYARVPWDSESFGFPVYELSVDETAAPDAVAIARGLASLDDGDASLVCTKVDQQAVPLLCALAQNGFYPVETVLEVEGELAYAATLPRQAKIPVRLRPAQVADLPEMIRIASAAFWSDRFHLDPNLSNDAADERYARWVERAFDSDDLLFAYERTDESAIIGFYQVRKVADHMVDLTLAAVDPTLTGLGLGSVLYRTVMAECVAMGYTTAQSRIVARNLPVLNIFSAMRFAFQGAQTSLHRFRAPESAMEGPR